MKKAITILSVLATINATAQIINIRHEKVRIPDLKNKTMYFVLPESDNEFRDVVKKTWTFNKYNIITQDQAQQNYALGNVFFTNAQTYERDMQYGGTRNSSFEYKMWSPTEKGMKNGKEIKNLDIRFAEPYYEIKIEGDYWYAGFFKNFLQQMQGYMNTFIEKGKAEMVPDPAKIGELKNATLYVPNYIVGKEKAEELFSKYPYKYQLISSQELSKKILAGENVYYLLTCIFGENCKILSVFNSQTGQLAYHSLDAKPVYKYLRKNDIADIADAVGKAGK